MAELARPRTKTANPFFANAYGPPQETPAVAEVPEEAAVDTETPTSGPVTAAEASGSVLDAPKGVETAVEPPQAPAEAVAPEVEEPVAPSRVVGSRKRPAKGATAPAVADPTKGDEETPVSQAPAVVVEPRSRVPRPRHAPTPTGADLSVKPAQVKGWPQVTPTPDYRVGLDEPRGKVPLYLSTHVGRQLRVSLDTWTRQHPEWVIDRGGQRPGASAWLEGLIRLGMKHINDPDLFEAIPVDARRTATPGDAEYVRIPAGARPPAVGEAEWELPEQPGTKQKASVQLATSFGKEANTARTMWGLVTHPEYMTMTGDLPGPSGWLEGLARIGLKWVNDPELGTLIPSDARRTRFVPDSL